MHLRLPCNVLVVCLCIHVLPRSLSQSPVPCSDFPTGTWDDPNFPQSDGEGGYPVGVRKIMTECDGCNSAVDGLNWTLPFFGFPPGAWFILEGKLWLNWHYSLTDTLDLWRIDLRAQYNPSAGSAPPPMATPIPQIVFRMNPISSTKTFATLGQNRPGNYSYFKNYSWPFTKDLPVSGFDARDGTGPDGPWGSPAQDSNYTVRIKVQRLLSDTGFTITVDGTNSFVVTDFPRTPGDSTTLNQFFAVHALGMERHTARFWASGFAGVPPHPGATSTTTSTTTTTSSGRSTTLPGGGSTTLPGGGSTTLPGGGSTTLPGGGSTTLPGGGSTTRPDGGGSTTLPGGGSTTSPDGGGSTTRPDGGGSTTSPDGGGSTTGPDGGGSTTSPDGGGSTTSPDGGGSTTSPDGGGSTTSPDGGGSTTSPDGGGSSTGPDGGGSTTRPDAGGSTTTAGGEDGFTTTELTTTEFTDLTTFYDSTTTRAATSSRPAAIAAQTVYVGGPIMAAIAGGLLAASAASLAYYSITKGAVVVGDEDEGDDLEDVEEVEETISESLEPDIESYNAENYVDVDPDNSFWRATTLDAYA